MIPSHFVPESIREGSKESKGKSTRKEALNIFAITTDFSVTRRGFVHQKTLF